MGAAAASLADHALPARHEVVHGDPDGAVTRSGRARQAVPGSGFRVDATAHAAPARCHAGRRQALRHPFDTGNTVASARQECAGAVGDQGHEAADRAPGSHRQLGQSAAPLPRSWRLARAARRWRAGRSADRPTPDRALWSPAGDGHHAGGQDAATGDAGHAGHPRRQGHHRDRPEGRCRPDAAHVCGGQARRPTGPVLPVPPGLPGDFRALQRHRQLRAHHRGGHPRYQRPALLGQLGCLQGILLALLEHRGPGASRAWPSPDLRVAAQGRDRH